jgi:hypothetical protein
MGTKEYIGKSKVPYAAPVANRKQGVIYVNRRPDRTPVGNHLICDVMLAKKAVNIRCVFTEKLLSVFMRWQIRCGLQPSTKPDFGGFSLSVFVCRF